MTSALSSFGHLVSCDDYEAAAAKVLASAAPGTLTYFSSGAGDEITLERNRLCFRDWALLPRVLIDVSSVSTSTTILGRVVSQPFGIAPSAFQRLLHPDGELGMARAAIACNIPHCLSSSATTSLEDVAAEARGRGLRFMQVNFQHHFRVLFLSPFSSLLCELFLQIYTHVNRSVTKLLVERAESCGYAAIVITVDRPVLGKRDNVARSGFTISWSSHGDPNRLGNASNASALYDDTITASLTWDDVAWFKSITKLPIVLKGIMSPVDAARAAHAGAAAVWISNHGGRQLDSAVTALDVLPACVAAVREVEAARSDIGSKRVEVWVDGGFRRGTDVIVALALGADFVFLGRPPLWGLTVGGEAGVKALLSGLGDEVRTAMQLLGTVAVKEISSDFVVRRGPLMALQSHDIAKIVALTPRL